MANEVKLFEDDYIVAKELFKFFKETNGGETITYGDLSTRAKNNGAHCEAINIHFNLDRINKWCRAYFNDCPMISAIVINANKKCPGSGFLKLRKKLKPNMNNNSDWEAFLEEWKAVKEYKKWDDVINAMF